MKSLPEEDDHKIKEKQKTNNETSKRNSSGNSAIVFFSALDEYNMVSSEEAPLTKLQVSLKTFEKFANFDLALSCTLILFLNKSDIFEKKIDSDNGFASFKNTFPHYKGKKDVQQAAEHIIGLFKAQLNSRNPGDLHIHVTCALDTEAMSVVFDAVKNTLIGGRMVASGMIV